MISARKRLAAQPPRQAGLSTRGIFVGGGAGSRLVPATVQPHDLPLIRWWRGPCCSHHLAESADGGGAMKRLIISSVVMVGGLTGCAADRMDGSLGSAGSQGSFSFFSSSQWCCTSPSVASSPSWPAGHPRPGTRSISPRDAPCCRLHRMSWPSTSSTALSRASARTGFPKNATAPASRDRWRASSSS